LSSFGWQVDFAARSGNRAKLCIGIPQGGAPDADQLIVSSTQRTGYSGNTAGLMIAEATGAAAASRRLIAAETRSRAENSLITVQMDVVDAHFAGLNTTHYLLKAFVFDLQCITD
jgi:hypothetical protein